MPHLPMEFFVGSVGLGFINQLFAFGLSRFFRVRTGAPPPVRLPVVLLLLLTKWYWGGIIVFPLFTVSTTLSLIAFLLEASPPLYLAALNMIEIPYILASIFSLMGWILLTWMILDITWVSVKHKIRRLSQRVILFVSVVTFAFFGLFVVAIGIYLGSIYTVCTGLIFISAGVTYLTFWYMERITS